ncbi:AAA family ATPase [Streptomyces sp. TRM66268-LWL]|uniref:AAA family ATPase n=1 Tax=Streptomyces polyasparticus TaxID=2767826 RepID=A0ABR7SRD3_9ACTN|nr:LuxR family transcriptional regulator [Streptomyces polyasparticus]MBC9717354.1 AAA family ATPase [Streptomyces polyasparticus]
MVRVGTRDEGGRADLAGAVLEREGTLLVTGPPGSGKSTLLAALADRATARGGSVLRLCPQPPDRDVPFAVVAELLRTLGGLPCTERLPVPQRQAVDRVLRRHEAPSQDGPDPLAVRLALGEILAAAAPTLIVLDNAHCADPAGAGALACLPSLPVAVVAACPDAEGSPEFLAGAPQFTPAPLAVDEVAALLAVRDLPARLAGRVHRAGGGNPRITLDIVHALAALPATPHTLDELPLPARVRTMARQRLDVLPPQTRHVLLSAALADRPTPALLRRSTGRDVEDEIRTATQAGLLRADGGELRFTAEVFAAQLRDDSSWADRSAAHRSLTGAVTDPVAAAFHRALATDDIDAGLAADLEGAARTARARGDRSRAAELSLLAARRTPPAPHGDAQQADAVRRFVAAAVDAGRAGRVDLARRAADEVLGHATDAAERVRSLLAILDAAGQALDDLDEVFARATGEAAGDPALLAAVELRLAWKANLCDGDPVRARAAAARAAALAGRGGDPRLAAMALTMQARLERILGDPGAEATLERALAAPVPPEPDGLRNQPRYLRIRHDLFDDRLDRARDGLLALLPVAERSGETEDLVEVLRSLAETETRAGRCAPALRYADRVLRITAEAGISPGPSWYSAAFAEAAGGSFERARAYAVRGARASEEEHDQVFLSRNLHVLGLVQLVTGSAADAVENLRRVRAAETAQQVADPSLLRWPGDLAEALALAGNGPQAEELIGQYGSVARELGRSSALGGLDRARAVLLTLRGESEPAAVLLGETAARFEGLGLPLEQGRCLWLLSRTRLRQRRRAAARQALADALELFDGAAAHAWSELVREALDRLDAGGVVRASADGLTTAEEQLAGVVAEGASNREAAARLHLSVKTVETMLTRIYRKLGVQSRAQLAATRAVRP